MAGLLIARARRRKAARRHSAAVGQGTALHALRRRSGVTRARPRLGFTAGSRQRGGLQWAPVDWGTFSGSSPGYSAGARRRSARVGKRVPPPGRPHGRLGGRGAGYRYPSSGRNITVGQALVDVGRSKCVPCSDVARMARG